MCLRGGTSRLPVRSKNTIQEDDMHPHIAYELGELRRSELLAEAAHQRLIHSAKGARTASTGRGGHRAPLWWRLRPGALRSS
jgi:hypothetical protein